MTALIAITTVMMLQSTRAFVSYLVFTVDQSHRVTIATIALLAFAFQILTWLLIRFAGIDRLLTGSMLLLISGRLGLQVIEQPVFRLVTGGLVIVAWGLLIVTVAGAHRRSLAVGLILSFGLDLALRTFRGSLDLLWMPGLFQTAQVIVLLLLLIYCWWRIRDELDWSGSSWRSAGALIAIGPAIALFHLITGNIAYVSTHTGLSASGSSALLATALTLGLLIAVLRLLAINMGAVGGPLVGRFILFDAIIGGIALSFSWAGDGLALLGVFFVTLTVTELVIFALAANPSNDETRSAPVSVLTTLGLLIEFVVLFIYFISSGSGAMLAVAWIGLVAAAFVAAVPLTGSLRRGPLNVRDYGAPAVIVVALLAGSILWSYEGRATPVSDTETVDSISVISYNIQSGFSRDNYWDLEATAQVIENSGADIVFLQEVGRGWLATTGNDELTWFSRRLDMPYAWGPASSDDLWGNAILSRFPITSERVVKYDSTENLKRSALIVEIDVGDRSVVAITTHLDNPNEASQARSEQIDQLIDLLELDRTTILAGDFNIPSDDPLIHSIVETGLIDAGRAGGATGATSEDGRRIDFVFVTPDLSVEDASVIDSDASDHRPVTVTLDLP